MPLKLSHNLTRTDACRTTPCDNGWKSREVDTHARALLRILECDDHNAARNVLQRGTQI